MNSADTPRKMAAQLGKAGDLSLSRLTAKAVKSWLIMGCTTTLIYDHPEASWLKDRLPDNTIYRSYQSINCPK